MKIEEVNDVYLTFSIKKEYLKFRVREESLEGNFEGTDFLRELRQHGMHSPSLVTFGNLHDSLSIFNQKSKIKM